MTAGPSSLALEPIAADSDLSTLVEKLVPAFLGEDAVAREVLTQTVGLLTRNPRPSPWGSYLALEAGTPVGLCAFKAAPDPKGVVEIAYMTLPAFEGRGHARAMAAALVRIAFAAGSPLVIAHTLPQGNASTRALLRNGFAFAGETIDPEDGLVWRWEKKRMSEEMKGGCACGRIRYTARIDDDEAYLCHCRMCQRATGSLSIAFKNIRKDAVAWEREPDWYASSPIARRPYCRECGTSLGFAFPDSEIMDITIATLDDPSRFRPKHHFGAESLHRAWLDTEGLPEYRTDEYKPLVDRWIAAHRQDAGLSPVIASETKQSSAASPPSGLLRR